jgi:hypothetical protein
MVSRSSFMIGSFKGYADAFPEIAAFKIRRCGE